MEVGNGTAGLLLLPGALVFQSEVGASELGYNATGTADNRTGHSWKAETQRLERIGDVIRKELKWTFILHTYGFGGLFFILAFYTFFSILNIRSFISSRPFMSTINGFLCLLGTSRAASLLIDPYNLKENMPRLFGQVLWDLGFPSIISAFSLVQLVFLQFTQFQIGPEGLRRKSCLSLIITAHFLLTIAMDILVASHENLMVVKHVVHYVFLTWGVFLCSNFLYSGYKIMSMIRSLPEGNKQRDADANYKGIMQLAMLAPHTNMAGSMTAALLPTLCAPKIHHQDNSNLSAVGFKSDGNSRILESESIPMLEELITSSGDETTPKPLVRASSLQNQTRNSQKFKLKPKLYFKSEEEVLQGKRASKPTKSVPAKEPESGIRPGNGILKNKDGGSSGKRKAQRTSFENENFCFGGERRKQSAVEESASDSVEEDQQQKSLSKLMSEISKDLNEMQILREEKTNKMDEIVQVHETGRKSGEEAKEEEGRDCRGSRAEEIQNGEVSVQKTVAAEDSERGRGRRKGKTLSWKKKQETEEDEATQECLLDEQPADTGLRAMLNHMAYVGRGGGSKGEEDIEKVKRSKVEWVLNITYITAMWGLMLCLSYMGKMYSPFGLPDPRRTVPRFNSTRDGAQTGGAGISPSFSSWPWLWFQTFCRALELAMGCAMANITSQPAANRRYSRALTFRYREAFYNM